MIAKESVTYTLSNILLGKIIIIFFLSRTDEGYV